MKTVEMHDLSLSELDRILPIVSGLLNCGGGVLRFDGVRAAGEVLEFEQALSERITPRAPVFVRSKESAEDVLTVEIPAGREPPYGYRDTIFSIAGDECRPATVEQVKRWVLDSSNGFNRWENRPCMSDDPESVIDRVALNESVAKVNSIGRMKVNGADATALILNAFSVLRYGRLLNAGLVLFGRSPARVAPQTVIRLTHFAGRTADGRIITTKEFDGPLCNLIDAVHSYIMEQRPPIVTFDAESGNRVERALYPVAAVREALVNACAHRDYESAFGGVRVRLFSDRLEIWNSGSLPPGVTVRGLNRGLGMPSVLVNPTICSHLYARSYMERDGRGSCLIVAQSKAAGTKARWAQDKDTGVCLTFWPGSLNRKVDATADPRIKQLIDVIAENPGLRKPDIAAIMGIQQRSLQLALNALRAQGLVEFCGSRRTGGYYARKR